MSSCSGKKTPSASAYTDEEVNQIVIAIQGLDHDLFEQYPGGWRNEISTALVDAVYSAQQRYSVVLPKIEKLRETWETSEEDPRDSLKQLAQLDEEDITSIMGRNRVGPGRPWSTTKAEAIIQAASNLSKYVNTAAEVRELLENKNSESDSLKDLASSYTKIRGLGDVTFTYFMMNLGVPGIKADSRVMAFVENSIGRPLSTGATAKIVADAHEKAELSDVSLLQLDHAIWLHQRALD